MLTDYKLKDYLKEYPVTWKSAMPAGCPPKDILVAVDHAFFRYSKRKDHYSEDDFKSYAELNPNKDWGDMLPLAVGLSVVSDEKKAKRNMKLPMLKHYKGIICLYLNPKDGVLKQTGVHKTHYTWWRTTSFNMFDLKMLEL